MDLNAAQSRFLVMGIQDKISYIKENTLTIEFT